MKVFCLREGHEEVGSVRVGAVVCHAEKSCKQPNRDHEREGGNESQSEQKRERESHVYAYICMSVCVYGKMDGYMDGVSTYARV